MVYSSLIGAASRPTRPGKRIEKSFRIIEMIQDASPFARKMANQNLGKKQKEVLDAHGHSLGATNAEVAAHLKWPINRVTLRMVDLREVGLVVDAGKRKCKVTGSLAHCWRPRNAVLPPV
jgi:hypothetical protein